MNKNSISKKFDKINELFPLTRVFNNKIPYLPQNKLNIINYKSEDNSSYANINFNSTKEKNNYLNYKISPLKKCNSQILKNKEILPILSNRNQYHNINYYKMKKSGDKISLNKNPFKIRNLYLKEKNAINHINDSPKLKCIQKLNIINNNKEKVINKNNFIIKKKTLKSTKGISLKNIKEIKNNKKNSVNNNCKSNEKKSHISKPFKFREFYRFSRSRNISAHTIYDHYISEEMDHNFIPIKDDFTKFIEQKFSSPQNKLNKLYGLDKKYLNNIKELKNNSSIAFKDDFNIKEYQRILLGMVKKRISKNSLISLKRNFKKFNEKLLKNYQIHKGRYTKLADKIQENAPLYLINKLKKLDNDKIKENAIYLRVNMNKKKEENKFIQDEDNEE